MHDYVILGGGSSGCALAARLSEDPRKTVLLVEAGKDITAETAPADVLASYPGRAYFNPAFTWPGLDVMLGGAATNDPDKRKRARYEQARILGGGSSINGLIAVRGAPTDYDGWEDMGATGWNFASVLPYFRKLERDLDFADEYHGRGRTDYHPPLSRQGLDRIRRRGGEGAEPARIADRAGPERGLAGRRDAAAHLDRRERSPRLVRLRVPHAGGAAAAEPDDPHRDLRAPHPVRRHARDRRRNRGGRQNRDGARPRDHPDLLAPSIRPPC